MAKFNIRLRELRKSRGLSQQKLADYTKVTKSSINMYERGEREPSLETIETFADFFNVDMDYIIGTSEVPNKALVSDWEVMQQTNEEMADIYFKMRKNEKLTEGIKILCELPPDQLDAALLVLKAFQK
jgi:transcriptional regulator with XRE-family HTH domain